jgi:hypothetical protein
VTPASPWTTLLFLYENGLYTCRSRVSMIERVLDWSCENLAHFAGALETKNMEDQWQYRGAPPALAIFRGTPYPNSEVSSFATPHHRTAGCWGTTSFLHAVLRLANIPVKRGLQVGQALPNFITDAVYLSHGDDPYSRLAKSTPPFRARELLSDQATYDSWFVTGVSDAQRSANIGRRVLQLALHYLPDTTRPIADWSEVN